MISVVGCAARLNHSLALGLEHLLQRCAHNTCSCMPRFDFVMYRIENAQKWASICTTMSSCPEELRTCPFLGHILCVKTKCSFVGHHTSNIIFYGSSTKASRKYVPLWVINQKHILLWGIIKCVQKLCPVTGRDSCEPIMSSDANLVYAKKRGFRN